MEAALPKCRTCVALALPGNDHCHWCVAHPVEREMFASLRHHRAAVRALEDQLMNRVRGIDFGHD